MFKRLGVRIVILMVVAAVVGGLLVACDNPLLQTVQERVAEFKVSPDEIIIDLTYGGSYELNAQLPLWMVMLPHPWDGIGSEELPYELKVDAPGRIVFNVADLPSADAEDGTYFLVMVHDFSGDYENFYDGSTLDTSGLYSGAGDGNFTTDFFDVVVTYPTAEDPTAEYTVIDTAQLAPGNIYPVTYTDEPLVEVDLDEPNDEWRDAAAFGSIGTAYTRTIGWEDTDWYSFVPTVSDDYRIVVATNPYDPDDETLLDLDFPVQISVMVYDSGTDSIYHIGSDYDDAGTEADNYGLVDAYLTAGEPYLFEITSSENIDVGEYKIKVIPTQIDQDGDEPGNDDYVMLGGTEIPFGHANYLERSLHKWDTDFFWIDNTSLNLSNVTFAVETVKPNGEDQDLDVEISLLADLVPDGNLGHYNSNYDGGFADLYYGPSWPEQRWEVRTQNASSSTIDYYQPTGLYWIRFIYGPDYWDYDSANHLPTAPGTRDDDIGNTAEMDTLYAGGFPSYHTIYSTDDVDYIRVYSGSIGQFTSITIELSVAETYGTTGTSEFYADMDIYNPDESLWGASQSVNGGGSPTIFVSGNQDDYYYVRVDKAGNSPIETGAYKLVITGS